MPITSRTRISTLLKADPVVQEVLEEFDIDLEDLEGNETLEQLCRDAGVNYWELKGELVAALPGNDDDMDDAWNDVGDDDEDEDDDERDDEDDDDWDDEDDDDWEDEDEDDLDLDDDDDDDVDDDDDDELGGVHRSPRRPQRSEDWQ